MASGMSNHLDQIRQMAADGKTHAEIKAWLESEHGIEVGVKAVTMALRRMGTERQKPRYDDVIPWTVKVQHLRDPLIRMLRAVARLEHGAELGTDVNENSVRNWMKLRREDNMVVDYDEETGARLVPRRAGIDDGWIREPDERLRERSSRARA